MILKNSTGWSKGSKFVVRPVHSDLPLVCIRKPCDIKGIPLLYSNDRVMPSMGAISGAASFGVPTGNNERLALLSLARRERAARDAYFSFVHPRHISGGMR